MGNEKLLLGGGGFGKGFQVVGTRQSELAVKQLSGTRCQNLQRTVNLSGNFQFSSVAQSCPTLCDPINRSTPGLPVHHQLPE